MNLSYQNDLFIEPVPAHISEHKVVKIEQHNDVRDSLQ